MSNSLSVILDTTAYYKNACTMVSEVFDSILAFVLEQEGYITKEDVGGYTIFGISEKAHPEAVSVMKNLSKDKALEMAKEIYRKDYWEKAGCDELEYPLNSIVFDTAVNMGVARALELARRSRSSEDYLLRRISYYTKLARRPKYSPYLSGWINRVLRLYEKFVLKEEL